MGTFGFRDVYIVTFWLYPSGLQPCVGLPLMELHMTSRTSPCTPPADPGSAVVAHAESSGGACTIPFQMYSDWLQAEILRAEAEIKALPFICSASIELRAIQRLERLNTAFSVARNFMSWCDDSCPVSVV